MRSYYSFFLFSFFFFLRKEARVATLLHLIYLETFFHLNNTLLFCSFFSLFVRLFFFFFVSSESAAMVQACVAAEPKDGQIDRRGEAG